MPAMDVVMGMMSGTSMDGVNAAVIETDGELVGESLGSVSLSYPDELRRSLKALEQLCYHCQGDLRGAFHRFEDEHKVPAPSIVETLTDYHIEAGKRLLAQFPQTVLIGFHGQTFFHAPQKRLTLQLGNAQRLGTELARPVIYDFRAHDVSRGGEGAPLAPVYHQAQIIKRGLAPALMVNTGGIANITWVGRNPHDLLAFDCGPANVLMDRFIRERTHGQELFDQHGAHALRGKVEEGIVARLFAESTKTMGENFYLRLPPKSLDTHNIRFENLLEGVTLEDGLATLSAFSAEVIVRSARQFCPAVARWIICGGGRANPHFMAELQSRAGDGVAVLPAEAVGIQSDMVEGELFAYLAARSRRGLPISFPKTTGVPTPLAGGQLIGL